MQQISSTQAKQNFGELLDAASRGPVAIEKHHKVKAILVAPDYFNTARQQDVSDAARREARALQASREKDRLMKHQRIAIQLLTLPERQRKLLLQSAHSAIQRWEMDGLCSIDYIRKWRELLQLPVRQLALAITSDLDGWGTALRQNSPWSGGAP